MCSIEEAWAGQTFDNHPVQSQADLRRKYMPIADNLLTRNDEFSISNKEPAPRAGNNGINTKMVRPLNIPNVNRSGNNTELNFSQAPMDVNNYGGVEPRPGYMSIYDNAGQGLPMPAETQAQAIRSPFGDINQAFQVSPIVERFMGRASSNSSNNENPLLHEDNDENIAVLSKKFNSSYNSRKEAPSASTGDKALVQMQSTLQDILYRLDNLESQMHSSMNMSMGSSTRNICDMILYILIGILIAFILYSVLRR
jgi:hypothetical protein